MRRVTAAAVLTLVMASEAGAARRGVIVRAADPAPVSEAPARAAMVAALGRSGAADVVVADPVAEARAAFAAGAVPRERLAVFARAKDLAAEGWRAFLAADVGFAEAQLVNARRALVDVLDLDGALGELADVSLRLGAVRLKGGRAAEAEAAFALARTLDPERELAANEWAPAVIAAWQGAGAGAATAALEVAAPAGARVAVDGRDAGAGATSVRVAVGEHVVVVTAPGRAAFAQIVAVPREGARVEAALEEDAVAAALGAERALAVGAVERAARPALAAVMAFAELDELWLVVVTWRGGEPTLLGQRCVAAPALVCSPVREVRVPSVARLGAAAASLVDGTGAPRGERLGPIVLEDTRATQPEPPRKDGAGGTGGGRGEKAWWESPWVWIGAGVLVVAAGGAVVLLGDDGPTTYEIVVPPLP